jgi:hypothetical protein
MRKRFGVFETIFFLFGFHFFCVRLHRGCDGAFSNFSPKTFGWSCVVDFSPVCRLQRAFNTPAAGSGCHLAFICWTPFVGGVVWPAAGGGVRAHIEGW